MNIEKIQFSPTLSIWKSKKSFNNRIELVELSNNIMNSQPYVKMDGFTFYENYELNDNEWDLLSSKSPLHSVLDWCLHICVELYGKEYSTISIESWLNRVKTKDAAQKAYDENGNLIFHNHKTITSQTNRPNPKYTFVYYIQMPDNLKGDDGVLYMKDKEDNLFSILPENDDLLIMEGDLEHVPNYAPESIKDRIVLAGNVNFDVYKYKKTLI